MSSSIDYEFKILTLGQSGVGKTSIILRYTDNVFNKNSLNSTLGVDYKTKDVTTENKTFRLCLWDTAGQEKFNHLTKQYYKGADGAFLIFDLTNKDSFNKIMNWTKELQSECNIEKVGVVLLGNKSDDEDSRVITKDEAENLASKIGVWYYEVSALTKENIEKAFKFLIKEICNKKHLIGNFGGKTGKEKKIVLEGDNKGNEQTSKCDC